MYATESKHRIPIESRMPDYYMYSILKVLKRWEPCTFYRIRKEIGISRDAVLKSRLELLVSLKAVEKDEETGKVRYSIKKRGDDWLSMTRDFFEIVHSASVGRSTPRTDTLQFAFKEKTERLERENSRIDEKAQQKEQIGRKLDKVYEKEDRTLNEIKQLIDFLKNEGILPENYGEPSTGKPLRD